MSCENDITVSSLTWRGIGPISLTLKGALKGFKGGLQGLQRALRVGFKWLQGFQEGTEGGFKGLNEKSEGRFMTINLYMQICEITESIRSVMS